MPELPKKSKGTVILLHDCRGEHHLYKCREQKDQLRMSWNCRIVSFWLWNPETKAVNLTNRGWKLEVYLSFRTCLRLSWNWMIHLGHFEWCQVNVKTSSISLKMLQTFFCSLFAAFLKTSCMKRWIDRVVQEKNVPSTIARRWAAQFDSQSSQDISRAELCIGLSQSLVSDSHDK